MTELSLHGKNALVTGGSNGIGEYTALELARMGANVTIIGRNAERTDAAAQRIRQAIAATGNGHPPATVSTILADLSVLEQVRRASDEYRQEHSSLHILVNNAGGFFMKRQTTPDGYELTFALNHLHYFLLTQELLPLLEAGANGQYSRVVNVSSGAHTGGRLNFDDLQMENSFSGWRAYSNSKLANVLFTFELARRLEGKKISANSLHPGFVATNFAKDNGALMRLAMPLTRPFSISPEEGAQTPVYLAASPDVEGSSGGYYYKSRQTRAAAQAYDADAARKLWEVSEQLVGK